MMTKPQMSAVSCREQTRPHLTPGPPRFLHPRCSACGGPSPSGPGTRSAEATGGLASKGPSGFGSAFDPTLGSLLVQNLLEAQNDFPAVKGKASMPKDQHSAPAGKRGAHDEGQEWRTGCPVHSPGLAGSGSRTEPTKPLPPFPLLIRLLHLKTGDAHLSSSLL